MIVSIERRVDGELTSADTATLRVTQDDGTIVVNDEVVAPTSAGVYSFNTPSLESGDYVARWTFTVVGVPDDVVYRTFSVDQPVTHYAGVTLADIERHVAPRLGPYEEFVAGPGSSAGVVIAPRFKSSLDIGDYEDLYILRRGRLQNGDLIVGFDPDDRERLVASYNAATGGLTPDRNWTTAPVLGEYMELHYLRPTSELRRIVRQGLRRCYFWDTAVVSTSDATFTAGRSTFNLTDLVPWIVNSPQIKQVRYGSGYVLPSRVPWSNFYRQGASVYMEMEGAGVGSFYIGALRSHFTYVNGEVSYTGPDDDDDVLHVDLDYAAAAAHAVAWMLVPHRLFPISNMGMRINMEAAAALFTAESMKAVPILPDYPEIQFGATDPLLTMPQVGNL